MRWPLRARVARPQPIKYSTARPDGGVKGIVLMKPRAIRLPLNETVG